MKNVNRRQLLKSLGVVAGTSILPSCATSSNETAETVKAPSSSDKFRYCLNVSTIRGQDIGFVEEIELAAKTGYDAIEVWIPPMNKFVEEGGSLDDVRKRTNDLGITIENAIGFAPWIVDDEETRTQAMEQAKREMDMLAQIGCKRIAAPPAGATQEAGLDLLKAAERYRALLGLGAEIGVTPQLEVWGFSANLHLLGQALFVAAEARHPLSCILPDVYHLFKGGSSFEGLKLLSGNAVEMFHMNDYPASPAREEMDDSHRVYPGDGIAPLDSILRELAKGDTPTVLSLELFNRDYWKQDAAAVAQTGLEKMKAAVAKAIG